MLKYVSQRFALKRGAHVLMLVPMGIGAIIGAIGKSAGRQELRP